MMDGGAYLKTHPHVKHTAKNFFRETCRPPFLLDVGTLPSSTQNPFWNAYPFPFQSWVLQAPLGRELTVWSLSERHRLFFF